MKPLQDKIRGSLIGGAAGDALGYAVEFMDENSIFAAYGKKGIQDYRLDPMTGKAVISDDTQMTLFTASAVLFYYHRWRGRGVAAAVSVYAAMTYLDWLITQEMTYRQAKDSVILNYPDYPDGFISVIFDGVSELFSRRAPGLTCLSALRTRRVQREEKELYHIQSFIESKINNSKGCGGVMRVAPIGLGFPDTNNVDHIDREGAECAAITHGHSLGYMSAAVLVHIINRIASSQNEMTLKEIVIEARDTVKNLYENDEHIDELSRSIDKAVQLSENDDTDLNNIHRLGEGWVAEETLAIAIYCSLRYQHDFSKAIIASVNHKGDSDSTGVVTGNIVGAVCGYEMIEQKWKDHLEISEVILKTADMLYSAVSDTE